MAAIYTIGLDLGPPGQHTALAVAEQRWEGSDGAAHYHVRHLRRWTPGTSYPAIVADVLKLTAAAPLAGSFLAMDQTGVGRPVGDLLAKAGGAYRLTRIAVAAGHAASWADDLWMVPKRDLVGVLQVLLQTRRLQIAGQLAEATILKEELITFRAKTPAAGAETAESWRERPHDDLVLAVALACWYGERAIPPVTSPPAILSRRAW